MTPIKVRKHLDEHFKIRITWKHTKIWFEVDFCNFENRKFKNRIAVLRQDNMTYKWIFAILKIEKLKTFLSAVKRIGQMLKVTGTVNSKTGTRVSTIENNNSLKITFLNGIRNVCWAQQNAIVFLDWQNSEEWMRRDFYQKYVEKCFLCSLKDLTILENSYIKPVVLYCGSSGTTTANFSIL